MCVVLIRFFLSFDFSATFYCGVMIIFVDCAYWYSMGTVKSKNEKKISKIKHRIKLIRSKRWEKRIVFRVFKIPYKNAIRVHVMLTGNTFSSNKAQKFPIGVLYRFSFLFSCKILKICVNVRLLNLKAKCIIWWYFIWSSIFFLCFAFLLLFQLLMIRLW